MERVYGDTEELIGKTPLLEMPGLARQHEVRGRIFGKLEFMNPNGSSMDRAAKRILEEAERRGDLHPQQSILVVPTSGNFGISAAAIGIRRGYRTFAVLPENTCEEKREILDARCAEVILTPAQEGIAGAVKKATEMAAENERMWVCDLFSDPAGPLAHYETTGPEIWEALDGKVDAFVCAVGSGAAITGIGRYLKEKNPDIRIVAVEPAQSPVLAGGAPGFHKLEGIGAGFLPSVLDTKIYDEISHMYPEECYLMSRDVAVLEGLLVGITSGAALNAAVDLAVLPEFEGKNIVALLPDGGERYLSTELYR